MDLATATRSSTRSSPKRRLSNITKLSVMREPVRSRLVATKYPGILFVSIYTFGQRAETRFRGEGHLEGTRRGNRIRNFRDAAALRRHGGESHPARLRPASR